MFFFSRKKGLSSLKRARGGEEQASANQKSQKIICNNEPILYENFRKIGSAVFPQSLLIKIREKGQEKKGEIAGGSKTPKETSVAPYAF